MGDVGLEAPGEVRVVGTVQAAIPRGTASRASKVSLEGGEVVYTEEEPSEPGVLRLDITRPREGASTWFALRVGRARRSTPGPRRSAESRGAEAHTRRDLRRRRRNPFTRETGRCAAAVSDRLVRSSPSSSRLADVDSPSTPSKSIRGEVKEAIFGISAEVGLRRSRKRSSTRSTQARRYYAAIASSAGKSASVGRGVSLAPADPRDPRAESHPRAARGSTRGSTTPSARTSPMFSVVVRLPGDRAGVAEPVAGTRRAVAAGAVVGAGAGSFAHAARRAGDRSAVGLLRHPRAAW